MADGQPAEAERRPGYAAPALEKGLDILELQPSHYLSANELEAARRYLRPIHPTTIREELRRRAPDLGLDAEELLRVYRERLDP